MEKTSKPEEQREFTKVETCVITRVHEGRRGLVFFDMCINGVYINGMSVVAGSRGDFLSYPAHKGADGKWYNYAYIRISPEDEKRILDMVQRKLDE